MPYMYYSQIKKLKSNLLRKVFY